MDCFIYGNVEIVKVSSTVNRYCISFLLVLLFWRAIVSNRCKHFPDFKLDWKQRLIGKGYPETQTYDIAILQDFVTDPHGGENQLVLHSIAISPFAKLQHPG